ncbi:MAG TPA: PHP domain-containing protein [Candidatus Bathyarchaeia archaeon]|jgi:HisJ family histidinol phosphate phosphatase|nr:PHP domain-containing protein [Candidatus Bathyarchaeia archaeon]
MIRVDNHSHILLADISEMVDAARAKGLSEYSITEHVSQFSELRESVKFGSLHPTGRIFRTLDDYLDEFRKVRKNVDSEMKIKRGLEVDFLPRYQTAIGNFVNQEGWDVLHCSVHELEDGSDIETRSRPIDDPLAIDRWLDYFRLQHMALESDFVPFKTLAHPVRMGRQTTMVPPEINGLLYELAQTAKRKNKALELNGRDLNYAPQLVRALAQACSKASGRVSLGSDAHHPSEVFSNMEVALALVDEFHLEIC